MWPPGDLLGDGPDHGPSPRVSQPLRRLCDKPAAGAFRPLGQLGFCGDAAKYPTRETQDVKFGGKGQLFRIIVLDVRGKTVVVYIESGFADQPRFPPAKTFATFLRYAREMLAALRFSG
jgi:hypothetical protein